MRRGCCERDSNASRPPFAGTESLYLLLSSILERWVWLKPNSDLMISATSKAADLDEDDYAAMRKVVGYIHRHLKQRPGGDVTDTRWRKSLMNWGHDPLK